MSDIMGITGTMDSAESRHAHVAQLGADLGGRQGDRRQVALSRVRMQLKSEEDVRKCLDFLWASDRKLAADPRSMYEWVEVIVHGTNVYFGVAWYDREFYAKKKEAYLSKDHGRLFDRFGVGEDELRVQHYVLD